MGHERPKTMRSGVMARLASRSLSVQSPSQFVTKLMGFALRSCVAARYSRIVSGARQMTQTATFSKTRDRRDIPSVQLPQVHPGVERSDLVLVAVEHQRLAPSELADPSLGRLAPSRVMYGRIDVRVEAVLLWRGRVPRRLGLLVDEPDPDDGLGALEPVLPRHHDADRRTVLVGQHLPVEAHGQERQRVERLVQA